MTKILCVGDIHVSDHAPVNCHDTYTDDIIEMLHWTATAAAEMGCDAVAWAGDVFHHKAPSKNSHALVLKMVGVVRAYQEAGVPLWIAAGNHDLSYDLYDSIHEKQPLGVLYAAGANELIGWHPELPLYGAPWRQDWERDLEAAFTSWLLDPWRFEPPLDNINHMRPRHNCLAITHMSLFPPALVGNVPYEHIPAEKVAKAMGNEGSLYYGHIHDYHGVFEVDGVTFANMGAMSRGSLTESNTNRKIKVALWTDGAEEGITLPDGRQVTTLGEPGFIEVDVPHKPADEVFLLEQAKAVKDTKHVLDSFIAAIGSASLEISSVASVIDHVQRLDVDPPVKNLVVRLLEEQA